MSRIVRICLLLLVFASQGLAQSPENPRVRVKATGQAPRELINAREAAVEDALRRRVEAASTGQRLTARLQSHMTRPQEDRTLLLLWLR